MGKVSCKTSDVLEFLMKYKLGEAYTSTTIITLYTREFNIESWIAAEPFAIVSLYCSFLIGSSNDATEYHHNSICILPSVMPCSQASAPPWPPSSPAWCVASRLPETQKIKCWHQNFLSRVYDH